MIKGGHAIKKGRTTLCCGLRGTRVQTLKWQPGCERRYLRSRGTSAQNRTKERAFLCSQTTRLAPTGGTVRKHRGAKFYVAIYEAVVPAKESLGTAQNRVELGLWCLEINRFFSRKRPFPGVPSRAGGEAAGRYRWWVPGTPRRPRPCLSSSCGITRGRVGITEGERSPPTTPKPAPPPSPRHSQPEVQDGAGVEQQRPEGKRETKTP